MTRSIWTKWIIGAACLLLIVAAGCFWYYQHTTAAYKQQADKDDKLLQEWEADKAKQTTTAEKEETHTPAESTPTAEKPSTDTTQDNETPTTEVDTPKMSPFGLGPLPEIPKDWDTPYLWKGCDTINSELLTRVIIKMHNEGIFDKYSSVGINNETGLIRPIEYGSILVEYATDENGDKVLENGKPIIISIKGHPDLVPPGLFYRFASEIPSHIKVVTAEEIAIDPYEYLGLQKP